MLLLVGRAPVIDLVGDLAELGIERFQAVGGLQADPKRLEETQTMQCERFLEAFVQTGHRRGIEQPQLFAQGEERVSDTWKKGV